MARERIEISSVEIAEWLDGKHEEFLDGQILENAWRYDSATTEKVMNELRRREFRGRDAVNLEIAAGIKRQVAETRAEFDRQQYQPDKKEG